MAWPLSRLYDFVANTVPTINEDFLDAIQDWVIALTTGAVSVLGLTCDGTGGQLAIPREGAVVTSRTYNSTTVPSPDSGLVLGEHHKHSAPAAMGTIAPGNNQVDCGWGIYSTEELPGTGYKVTLHAKPSGGDADNSVILALGALAAGPYEWTNKQVDGQGRLQFELRGRVSFVSFVAWVF